MKAADNLGKVAPDDLVVVTYSGHMQTQPSGTFYLLRSDSGSEVEITSTALAHFISSEEVSEWLWPFNAGEM